MVATPKTGSIDGKLPSITDHFGRATGHPAGMQLPHSAQLTDNRGDRIRTCDFLLPKQAL